MKYKKYPRLEKALNGYFYAYYVNAEGRRQRRSLRERNELRAQAKFVKLLRDVDRGVLGFHAVPHAIPFPQAVQRYLEQGTSRLREASLVRHRFSLERHLIPHFVKLSLKAIGPQAVLGYIRTRENAGAAPNTIYKELAALSAVFRFYVQLEEIAFNPVVGIQKPRLTLVRPNYAPTIQEVIKILNYISPYARRYFLCLWATGARLSEIRDADVGDVDVQNRTIRLRRKGGKMQILGLNNIAFHVIEEELTLRNNPPPEEPLFLNRQKRRCGRIDEVLAHACEKAGVRHVTEQGGVRYVTHHGLRHSYARFLRKSGHTLEAISKLLGHKNTYVTQTIYVDLRDDEVIEMAKHMSLEPLEKVLKK